MKENLIKKISLKKATIGIIGLGYVGLPLAINCSKKNYNVIGFDIDKDKVQQLNNGKSYIKRIKKETIVKLKKNFFATKEFKNITSCDVIVICVPTPLTIKKKPDLSYLKKTIKSIFPYIKKKQLISLESTSYPGTTKEELLDKFNKKFIIGEELYICFSPEREDPGNKYFKNINVPKIISGATKNCLKNGTAFYQAIFKSVVPVSSTETAEFTKLLENIYRSVNIGLVNEMKIIAHKMNINIYEVIRAAATKPFGFRPFLPGPGLGGHCIPIDPFYMSWKSKQFGYDPKFIKQSGKINTYMPKWIINNIKKNFKNRKIKIKNKNFLIIGVAYKKNIDDIRESPALEIIDLLKKMQVNVKYHDPYIPHIKKDNIKLKSVKINKSILKKFDAVIIVTDHDNIDYSLIQKISKVIFDCRGRYNMFLNKNKDKNKNKDIVIT